MPATKKITAAQRRSLNWLAEAPTVRYLVAYGKAIKVCYGLLDAGMVERVSTDDGARFYITAAGKEVAA